MFDEMSSPTPHSEGGSRTDRRDRVWPPDDIEWDPRYKQCSREMWVTILYWVAYTVATLLPAWWLGHGKTVEEMAFIAGIPAWIFWPILISLVFCTLVPPLMVKFAFRNFSIAADEREEA